MGSLLAQFCLAGFTLALVVGMLPAAVGSEPPIRIGASLGLTGQYAPLGQNVLRGLQLCVKDANRRGGVLGRAVELRVKDDRSQARRAAQIYEELITEDNVELVVGPYSSPITDKVAEVTERHRMPMIATGASSSAIFRKGRRYLMMMLSPSEVYLEGLIDLAAQNGLKRVALIHEDTIALEAMAMGAAELAKSRGLEVVLTEAWARGTTDFGAILTKVKAANPDVLAAATYFQAAVDVTRQMKELDVNPRMFGVTIGGDLPKFREMLGAAAEFVYGSAQWQPELVELRAGGLIPIARRYPGAREFVEGHAREFPGAGLSYHTAQGYASCELLLRAVRKTGSLDSEKIREALLTMDVNTVFGAYRVDESGFQIAHKMVTFQWQSGKKVIVWPALLAPGKPRFPTPPWSQRP